MSDPDLLSIDQFAAECRVSRRTVQGWVDEGRIVAARTARGGHDPTNPDRSFARSELAKVQQWNTTPTGPPVPTPLRRKVTGGGFAKP